MTQSFVETLREEDIPDAVKEAALKEGVALDQFVKEGVLLVASRIVQQAEEDVAELRESGEVSLHDRGCNGVEDVAGNEIEETTKGGGPA